MEKSLTIKISIGELISFTMRGGSIDASYLSANRAREGIRLHKKVQEMRKKQALLGGYEYEREYSLHHGFTYKECDFLLEGRADGILLTDPPQIEEIKSTSRALETIEEDTKPVHWAQLMCYAYIFALQKGLNSIVALLTYISVDTEEIISFRRELSFQEAEVFFGQIIEKYYRFAKMDLDRIKIRNSTAAALNFPFDRYRQGQREMAVAVYAAVKNRKRLFVKAPTGIGKTISVLFPCIKALERGELTKIFYLTSRDTNKLAAFGAMDILESRGLVCRRVNISAKEKMCFLDKPSCNPIDCFYADGHFDRVNEAILDIIEKETSITGEIVKSYGLKYSVCPFELQLDLSMFSDVVICDYNYAYDPTARLKRYFSGETKNDFALLVDEAHNLAQRGREMFSAQIAQREFSELKKQLTGKKNRLRQVCVKINIVFKGLYEKLHGEDKGILSCPEELAYLLREFMTEADKLLSRKEGPYDKLIDLYFKAMDFLRVQDNYNETYVTIYSAEGSLKLFCLDPSAQLVAVNKVVKATVYFSATLSPMDYYRDILGGREGDFQLTLQSPFDSGNLNLLVNNAISTKYKDREATYEAIGEALRAFVSAQKGNYMVFFPSYAYMERVYEIFCRLSPQTEAHMQTRGDRSGAFMALFERERENSLLGFAVLGAGYSEGIDLYGEKLIGAAIVGVGLPQISLEVDAIKEYYQNKLGLGYQYAYMYPGMNKVMQAAGRVIRTENDRGVVLLIDVRFLTGEYLRLFPWEWRGYVRCVTEKSLTERLRGFWEG